MSLINEQGKTRPTLSNWNPVELNYYSLMINLDKYDGSCITLSCNLCPKQNRQCKFQCFLIS